VGDTAIGANVDHGNICGHPGRYAVRQRDQIERDRREDQPWLRLLPVERKQSGDHDAIGGQEHVQLAPFLPRRRSCTVYACPLLESTAPA